jgi:hypothetical protein
MKKLALSNSFTFTSDDFKALSTLTNLEDLSIKAENPGDLSDFLNKNLQSTFKRLRRLNFNCSSTEEVPACLTEPHPSLMDLTLEVSSSSSSFKRDQVLAIARPKRVPGFTLRLDMYSFEDARIIIKECSHCIFRFNGLGWSGDLANFENALI